MIRDFEGRTLLGVFAHPDDESLACGGLLAWCAERGATVSLLCATHGEDGPGAADTNALRNTRATELAAAARVLGVRDVTLLDHPDGMLPWIPADALESDIRRAVARLRPDVVVTFGADGLYWHPDHIAVHERTTAAIAAMVARGDPSPALYYVTMPPGAMRAVVACAAERVAAGGTGARPPALILGIENADAFGADASPPTLIVDAGAFAARKLAAIRCHATQLTDCALTVIADDDAARLMGIEHFHRAEVGASGDAFVERLAAIS